MGRRQFLGVLASAQAFEPGTVAGVLWDVETAAVEVSVLAEVFPELPRAVLRTPLFVLLVGGADVLLADLGAGPTGQRRAGHLDDLDDLHD